MYVDKKIRNLSKHTKKNLKIPNFFLCSRRCCIISRSFNKIMLVFSKKEIFSVYIEISALQESFLDKNPKNNVFCHKKLQKQQIYKKRSYLFYEDIVINQRTLMFLKKLIGSGLPVLIHLNLVFITPAPSFQVMFFLPRCQTKLVWLWSPNPVFVWI